MIGVGLAWASILSMPYVILSSSIPAGKMGIYMGIFNFFITLPQIVNGLLRRLDHQTPLRRPADLFHRPRRFLPDRRCSLGALRL